MSGFSLLWGKTLDSSIWRNESKETRILWVTMMMMRDQDGIVQSSVIGLADRARISREECRESLQVLLSPDGDDTSHVLEGRRIVEVPGGWRLVNHDQYRFSTEAKREFWRSQKAEQRKRDAENLAKWQAKQAAKIGAEKTDEEKAFRKEYLKRRKLLKNEAAKNGAKTAIDHGFKEVNGQSVTEPESKDEFNPP